MSITGAINGVGPNETYTYDDLARLASATGFYAQRNYSYDRFGNRTGVSGGSSQTVVLQQPGGGVTNNRIATVNGLTYSYDAAGNLTGDGHSYKYDAAGRIANVDTTGASYSYDFANQRVKKVVGTGANAVTTYYIWEGAQVIAEYSNAPAGAGGTSYYLADRLSTRMTTDSNGAFKGTQDHLPFGEDSGTSTGQIEKHRFTSYERDGESDSDYALNRQYAQKVGRFMQPDPTGTASANPQSLNRYAYTGNDPINSVDPLGLFPVDAWRVDTHCVIYPDGKVSCTSTWNYLGRFEFGPGEAPVVDVVPDIQTRPALQQNRARQRPRFSLAKLKECIEQLYGVTTRAFTAAQRGSPGSFTGFGPDALSSNGYNSEITVVHENRVFNQRELGNINVSLGGRPGDLWGIQFGPGNVIPGGPGYADVELGPYRNYGANNIRDPLVILATQIHELGNSLADITGVANAPVSPLGRSNDPDAGVRLERCVFGRQVE